MGQQFSLPGKVYLTGALVAMLPVRSSPRKRIVWIEAINISEVRYIPRLCTFTSGRAFSCWPRHPRPTPQNRQTPAPAPE